MPISRVRLFLAAGAMAVVAGSVVGCGDTNPVGGISHTSGSQGRVGDIELQDVHLTPASQPDSCVIQRDRPAQLVFTAVNTGADQDRLVRVDTDAAQSVQIQAPQQALVLNGGSRLAAGQPVEQLDEPKAPDQPISVQVNNLRESVQPGKNIDVSFTFDKAGSVEFAVPVDSCPTQSTGE